MTSRSCRANDITRTDTARRDRDGTVVVIDRAHCRNCGWMNSRRTFPNATDTDRSQIGRDIDAHLTTSARERSATPYRPRPLRHEHLTGEPKP